MRNTKKSIALLLTTALLLHPLTPSQEISAKVLPAEQTMTVLATEEPTTEEPTTKEFTTEESTIEEPTTEEPTTEEPTTSPYVVSTLNPAKSKVVVFDPGHDSRHSGARKYGVKEEAVVLDIAKYSKKELDHYGNITVYMTRTSNRCTTGSDLDTCLIFRNNLAKKLQANFLVSFHIDYDDNSNVNGSRILPAYHSGYHNNVYKETHKLGKLVLGELGNLGLANRGFLQKTASFSRYPNGSKTDFYSIVRNGVRQNIPSLIIEHGFVTNKSECNKYFKTKKQRQKLGIADANAIVSYYGLQKNKFTGSFCKKGKSTYYINGEGKKIAGWVKENGKWYYMNPADAKMMKGFVTIGKNTFYLDSSTGEMKSGWFTVKEKNYFAKGNGIVFHGKIFTILGSKYYFNSEGQLKKGWVTLKNKTYYFNKVSGAMVYGWQRINGKLYYFSKKTGKLKK